MSLSAANQVILHPYVSNTIKVWSTTVGRDKTYRAVQYFSRFLAWYTFRKGYTKETVARFQNAKSAIGQARKLFRVGKFMEHFQAAIKVAESDPVLYSAALGRQLGYALYLVHDSLVWLHSAKVYQFEKTRYEFINKQASRFWFLGLFFSLVSGGVKTRALTVRAQKAKRPQANAEKEQDRKAEVKQIAAQRAAVNRQLVQDALDILIPATGLGFIGLDDGIVGLIGTFTAIMGLQSQARKVLSK